MPLQAREPRWPEIDTSICVRLERHTWEIIIRVMRGVWLYCILLVLCVAGWLWHHEERTTPCTEESRDCGMMPLV